MDTTSLGQLLKSLCCGTQWKYAVFWKLKHRSRMLLTWEDGYCDYPKPRHATDLSDNVCFNDTNRILSFGYESGGHCGSSTGYSIGLAVANMSCLFYSLGEGIVGKVAFTGKHSWVFADEFNSKFVPECPDEWKLQFAAGIKTILLVPVVPHGVLQLGSLDMLMEDLLVVDHIKDLFSMLQNVGGTSGSRNHSGDLLGLSPSSHLSGGFAAASAMTLNPLDMGQPPLLKNDTMFLNANQISMQKTSILNTCLPQQFSIQGNIPVPQEEMQHICRVGKARFNGCMGEITGESQSVHPGAVELAQSQMVSDQLDMSFDVMSSFSRLEEDFHVPKPNLINQQLFAVCSPMPNSWEDLEEKNCQSLNASFTNGYELYTVDDLFANVTAEAILNIENNILGFPVGSELHTPLGAALTEGGNVALQHTSTTVGDGFPSLICKTDVNDSTEPLVWESAAWSLDRGSLEHPLDAVVSNESGALDDNRAATSNKIRSPPSCSSGQFTSSCQTQSRSEGGGAMDADMNIWNHETSMATRDDLFTSFTDASPWKGTCTLTNEMGQKMDLVYARPKKGSKLHRVRRKKAQTGDIQKPRPRDRQMIQDLVKELREIVPNGAKCSIDALLDRTARHMLFLRDVTNQAKKLRHVTNQPKKLLHNVYSKEQLKQAMQVASNDNSSYSNFQHKDASLAFELEGKPGVCPLIVKKLDLPGRMLIEMLCEEHGQFLEIVQIIRQVKLTILKGVMEDRSAKMWAHFIVEASRGFQRMDILCPLMQLLQRNGNHIACKF